ncbi:LysR family transcriptional regulator [Paenibacillus jamilae]
MELRQLQYFIQICKSGSLTKAKAELGVTQPTLSQQLRVLENEFNTPLFNRGAKGVEMTEAGKILLHKGNTIMNLLEEARYQMKNEAIAVRETLAIGCCPAELEYLAPCFIKFHEKHPYVQLKVVETADVQHSVLERVVDIGITSDSKTRNSIVSTYLYRQEMALFVHSKHSMAAHSFLPIRSLKQMNTILFLQQYKSVIEMYGLSCGLTVSSMIETTSISILIQWIRHGLGAALLPVCLVESLKEDAFRMVRFEDCVPCWDVSLVHLNSFVWSMTARSFLKEMNQFIRAQMAG